MRSALTKKPKTSIQGEMRAGAVGAGGVYFITGCASAVSLPYAKQTPQCVSGELVGAKDWIDANARCKACPQAMTQSYLSQPPPGMGAPSASEMRAAAPPAGASKAARKAALEAPAAPPAEEDPFSTDSFEDVEEDLEEPAAAPAEAAPPPPPAPEPTPEDPFAAAFAGVDPPGPVQAPAPAPAPEAAASPAESLSPFPLDLRGKTIMGVPGHQAVPAVKDARPSLDELLAPLGIRGGPSVLGFSSIRKAHHCLREFFWARVMGLELPYNIEEVDEARDKVWVSPLALGSLVHAMMEVYLKGSFFDLWQVDKVLAAVKPVYPLLAAEALRLWNNYLQKFGPIDKATVDVRAVELECRYYYPKRKCAGKQRSLCISGRMDALLRQLPAGGGRLPAEEAVCDSSPLRVHDLKTAAAVNQSTVAPWSHEGQALQNIACFNYGTYMLPALDDGPPIVSLKPAAERFGKAEGFLLTVIGKAQNFDPNKHLIRQPFVVPDHLAKAYLEDVGPFLYNEIGERLFSKHAEDPATWPKSYCCRDVITSKPCMFLPLCESAANVDYSVLFNVGRKLVPESIEAPKKRGKGRKKKPARTEGQDK